METPGSVSTVSRAARWTGIVLSTLPALMLLFSGAMKLIKPHDVVEGFAKLGWPDRLALHLGIVELACTVLYLVPATSVLGAVLLTGYMGGAIATHVRIEEPFLVQAALGVVLWLGLYLREPRLRALLPLRR